MTITVDTIHHSQSCVGPIVTVEYLYHSGTGEGAPDLISCCKILTKSSIFVAPSQDISCLSIALRTCLYSMRCCTGRQQIIVRLKARSNKAGSGTKCPAGDVQMPYASRPRERGAGHPKIHRRPRRHRHSRTESTAEVTARASGSLRQKDQNETLPTLRGVIRSSRMYKSSAFIIVDLRLDSYGFSF